MAIPIHSLLFATLSESTIFRDYRDAFEKAVGLPLTLHAPDTVNDRQSSACSPFCALAKATDPTCHACVAMQLQLEKEAQHQAKTLHCFAGFVETAVPVRVGDDVVAFLQTGRILFEAPNERQFTIIAKKLLGLGVPVDLNSFEAAYYASRVLTSEQYEAMISLLIIFSQHLAACGNLMLLQRATTEDSPIARARHIIAHGFRDELAMGEIAKRVSVSGPYFSMLFKKATGLNFVDYVARFRVEKAKDFLQNPNYRINEVAREAGFRSVSQFNRTFRRIVGASPRSFRTKAIAV